MEPVHLLFHVPRTGGQTLRDHLDRHLERDVDFVHLGAWDRGRDLEYEDLAAWGPEARRRLRSVSGDPVDVSFRNLFPGRIVREVVFVREPVARLVSHYNFRCTLQRRLGKEISSLETFLEEVGPDPMTRFLARRFDLKLSRLVLSDLLARLSTVWMVGTTERMDLLAPKLVAAMGLPEELPERANVTGDEVESFAELTPELADELRTSHELDAMLYRACVRLERATMQRLGIEATPLVARPVGFVPR